MLTIGRQELELERRRESMRAEKESLSSRLAAKETVKAQKVGKRLKVSFGIWWGLGVTNGGIE